MTALKKFQRLEASAIWRPDAAAQRRDVVVSLGEASLTLSDHQDRPLCHWSLAALERLNPGKRPAVFSPGNDAPDELEVAEAEMIDAIETVRRAINRRGKRPGRLRTAIIAGSLAAFAGLAVFWFPGALYHRAGEMVPEASRRQIGDRLLAQIAPVTGDACQREAAVQPLRIIARKTLPQDARLRVMPAGVTTVMRLPGNLFLLGRELIEDYETPEVAAGYLIAANTVATDQEVTISWLRAAGLATTLRLLATGSFAPGGIEPEAMNTLFPGKRDLPGEALSAAFEEAGISPGPYLEALGREGKAPPALTVPAGAALPPVMSDSDWVALQSVCED